MIRLFSNFRDDDRESEIPLPDELLSEIIFKYVPFFRWSSCLEKVSKQLRRCVFIAYKRVKSVDIRNFFPLSLGYEQFRKNKPNADSFYLMSKIFEKLPLVCPFLTKLIVFDVVTMLPQFDRLESIYLINLRISANYLDSLITICKSLKTLQAIDCSYFYSWFSKRFDIASRNLINVAFYNTNRHGFHLNEIFYFGSCCENLTTLKLGWIKMLFQINDSDEQIMTKYPNLKTLIVEVHDVEDMQIVTKALPNLHNLANLGLLIKFDWADYVVDFCVALNSLASRLLSFSVLSPIHVGELQRFLFRKCLNLRFLAISPLELSPSVYELPQLSANLQYFIFRVYPCVLTEVNSILMPNLLFLSNLTYLDLTPFYAQISETCQELYRLENLRHLRLPNQNPESIIGDHLLQIWASNGMLERLVTLEMPICSLVTDVGGCVLAEKARNLKILKFNGSRISDTSILIFAEVSKKLKAVTFLQDEPRLITVNALLQLVEKLVYLKTVTLDSYLATNLLNDVRFLPFAEEVKICHGPA